MEARSGSKRYFHKALRKYGFEVFEWRVLFRSGNRDELDSLECQMIVVLKTKTPNGYNLTDGGEGVVGCQRSREWREKLSLANKGKARSVAFRAKVSSGMKGKRNCLGRTLSPEHRARISAGLMGHSISEEGRAKISKSQRGRKCPPLSQEHRTKLSEALKGNKNSQGKFHSSETRMKMSNAHKGKPKTLEHRQKISLALKGRKRKPLSTEQKSKLSKTLMGNQNARKKKSIVA